MFSLAGRHIANMENSNRAGRYLGRQYLNRVSTVKGCRSCGRATVTGIGLVGVRARDIDGITRAGYAGLATCGRIWLCPVCNAKVMATRALELGLALAWAARMGYRVLWGSLTCYHDARTGLADLIDVQRAAWRLMVQSREWSDMSARKSGERIGYIRASEITVGVNGWHPHFHPLVIVDCSERRARQVADFMESEWVRFVRACGGEAQREGGQKISVLTGAGATGRLHEYVTKAQYTPSGLSLEMVWSQSKNGTGRKLTVAKTVPHWWLLDRAGVGVGQTPVDAATGEVMESGRIAPQLAAWWQFEGATEGHRMITWSRDLRKLAGVGVERSDEDLAGQEIGSIEDTVCYITPEGWGRVRAVPALQWQILDVLEQGGWLALRAFLGVNGVDWCDVQGVTPGGVTQQVTQRPPTLRHSTGVSNEWTGGYVDPEVFSRLLKL